MKLNKLKQLVDEHNQLPFPEHPSNDELSEWILELCELDAYFLGIANSILNSEKFVSYNLDDFYRMETELKNIFVDLDDDRIVLDACFLYMRSLRNIIFELNKVRFA